MDILSENFHYKDRVSDAITVCDHCGEEFSTENQQGDIEKHLMTKHPEVLKN